MGIEFCRYSLMVLNWVLLLSLLSWVFSFLLILSCT